MKKNIFIFLFICFALFKVKAFGIKKKNTGVISEKETTSVFFVQNDSLIKFEYKKTINLYNGEEYAKALEKALSHYDLSKEKKDTYWSYKFLFLIADIYDKTNKFNQSLEYYKKSLELIKLPILEENERTFTDINYAMSLFRIGSSYQKLSRSEDKSLYYLDSAKLYYDRVEKLPHLNNKIESIKANAFSNLSGIYQKDTLFDEAKEYVLKAISIHKKTNNKLDEAIAKNNLGSIYLTLGQFKKAKEIYLNGIELIRNENSLKATRANSDLYFNLAWAMRNLKDYKAYDFQEKSYDIQDDIRDKEFTGIIDEVTQKYDNATTLKLLKQEQELILLQEKDKTRSIVVIGVFLFIALIVVIGYYIFRQKNLELKLSKTELLQNQNLDKLKSEAQARVLDATMNGREEERKEIAEILHDSVSALLSSANLHLQATKKQFKGDAPIETIKAQAIITEASQKIRNLSHTLVSAVLLKFGLNFAIKDIAEKFSNSELNIEVKTEGLRRYYQGFEIKTYNIIQEFVNNILKHSKAKNAFIKIKEVKGVLFIEINDDGIGFDKLKITSKEGLGINQIEARIYMMKGKFNVNSQKGKGTYIKVELPIQEKKITTLF